MLYPQNRLLLCPCSFFIALGVAGGVQVWEPGSGTSGIRTIGVLADSEYRWRRDLLIDCVPEITDTLLICILVHPTEVYRDCTGRNVDLQLANV